MKTSENRMKITVTCPMCGKDVIVPGKFSSGLDEECCLCRKCGGDLMYSEIEDWASNYDGNTPNITFEDVIKCCARESGVSEGEFLKAYPRSLKVFNKGKKVKR